MDEPTASGARFLARALSAVILAGAALTCASQLAVAQNWPTRPITLIAPNPAGGGFDTVARVLADRMRPLLGQPIVVENRTGAGTRVGTQAAAKAAPDGYTLMIGALSNMALNPGLYANLPYDPIKDFRLVGIAVTWSYTLVARKDLPQNSLTEVIAFAKANPDKVTYASAGNGSGQHVAMAATEKLSGVKLTHVPYRGAQDAYQDILGGRVDLFFDISSTAKTQVEGGSVKALAVSSKERQPFHPDVPSVYETGAPLDMESWFGLFAPAGTPEPILDKLRAAMAEVMASRDVQELFAKTGGVVSKLSSQQAQEKVRSDIERWTRLLQEIGLKGE
ncbi:MAG: tripartite tricarboxylate transporter substrate binding protein [Hyphomicrobiales bacterium]|jgi:tripartite-type tricarboxylate transporter receptor subunit TctC|nr:tripartite tricarboxylate transporter substrate binding protein [Hyphomicrobiales bacterium]